MVITLEKELKRYKSILELTKKEQNLIKENNWKQLNKSIKEKGQVIEEIKELEDKSKKYRKELASKLELSPKDNFYFDLNQSVDPNAQNIKDLALNKYKLLEKISNLEEKNKERIVSKKQKLENKIKNVDTGLNINQAYSGIETSYEGKFIDQKE